MELNLESHKQQLEQQQQQQQQQQQARKRATTEKKENRPGWCRIEDRTSRGGAGQDRASDRRWTRWPTCWRGRAAASRLAGPTRSWPSGRGRPRTAFRPPDPRRWPSVCPCRPPPPRTAPRKEKKKEKENMGSMKTEIHSNNRKPLLDQTATSYSWYLKKKLGVKWSSEVVGFIKPKSTPITGSLFLTGPQLRKTGT